MKSPLLKKILSIGIAILLLMFTLVPAFAAEPKKNPVLIVTGFSEFPLEDPETGKMLFPIKQPVILDAVKQAAPFLIELLKSSKTQADYDKFYEQAIPIVNALFEPLSCNPDGTVAHPEVKLSYQYPESVGHYGIDSPEYNNAFSRPLYRETVNAVGADNVFIYGLDWRQDPFTIADELNTWVKHIKEVTGAKKVSIAGISMGGVMVSTYIAKYGTSDISNITMISSAFTGVAYVGELFKGKMQFNKKDLIAFLDETVGIDALGKVLGSTHIVEDVLSLVDTFLLYEKDKLYTDFVLPAFGYDLGFWSFVPNEDLAEAKEYIFSHSDASAAELAILNAKIDAYQHVQKNVGNTFRRAQANGVSLAILSNYNLPMPPVCPDSAYTGDKVIETKHTSGGATCAPLGMTLPDSTPKSKYLSPDRMIDASTCLFPECTWIIKNMEHVGFSMDENQCKFYTDLMTAQKQVDIDDDPDYPQFLLYNRSSHILMPLSLAYGDVNRDGAVNLVDARHVLRYANGVEEFTAIQREAADINHNNKATKEDARKIMRAYVGAETKADAIRDELIANGVPEDKLPAELPKDPAQLPPELQEFLKPLFAAGDKLKGDLASAGAGLKKQLSSAAAEADKSAIADKFNPNALLDSLKDIQPPVFPTKPILPEKPTEAETTTEVVTETEPETTEEIPTEAETESPTKEASVTESTGS